MAKKTQYTYEYKPEKAVHAENTINDGFATATFGIALMVLVIVILIIAPPGIVASFALYHRWLESITWITGFGSIMIAFGTMFHGRARQKASSVLFSVAALVGLILVLYIDYFRPDLALPFIFADVAQFEAFRMNIAAMSTIVIGASVLGMILVGVNLKRNG